MRFAFIRDWMCELNIEYTVIAAAAVLTIAPASLASESEQVFAERVLPVMLDYCWDCHDPDDSKGNIIFLDAEHAVDITRHRTAWRSAAAQLVNRTMPPARKPQPSEEQRIEIAAWITEYLSQSACLDGPYAGYVTARRLNRLEYDQTIRDLVGVDLKFSETFPADSGAGEGFNNNGESLFLPPMLMERYLEAARQIVDAAIVTPLLDKQIQPAELVPTSDQRGPRKLSNQEEATALVSIYVEDDYEVTLRLRSDQESGRLVLKVDGLVAFRLKFGSMGTFTKKADVRLTRGMHALSIQPMGDTTIEILGVNVAQTKFKITSEKAAVHKRLLNLTPGETPEDATTLARERIHDFVSLAYRRPLEPGEADRFMKLYHRAEQRGDPFEERMKLALKGVLVTPNFLFRIEKEPAGPDSQPISDHELATRLSYFLWSTMPDAELRTLADQGRLQYDSVLDAQANRLMNDPRSWLFAETFVGQWLGTKDVGGRVAPTHNEIQKFYTPEVAADMRAEAVWLFAHMIEENRSVLEFIDAEYTFLTQRLAKFYGYQDTYPDLKRDGFTKVTLVDDRRGGLLGLGAVLAMTSHFKEKSPVLRGAWVFDTMLGTPIPPPPDDVPSLQEAKKKSGKGKSQREVLAMHRNSPSCNACHNLIDPIGFALNNFDYLGRWEENERSKPIDTSGRLPTGETFRGPSELKQVLLVKKDEFARQLTRKLLAYALGRGLDDRDECTITQLTQSLESDDYRVRTLIKGIVLSTPFRNRQLIAK